MFNTPKKIDSGLVVVLYGMPGVGKTTLAATADDPEKIVLLEYDHGGAITLAKSDSQIMTLDVPAFMRDEEQWKKEFKAQPDILQVTSRAVEKVAPLFKKGEKSTIIVDTLSTFAHNRLQDLTATRPGDGFAQYRQLAVDVTALQRTLTSFAKNVIFIMHAKYKDADATAEAKSATLASKGNFDITPAMPGKAAWEPLEAAATLGLFMVFDDVNKGGKVVRERRLVREHPVAWTKDRLTIKGELPLNLKAILAEGVK